MGQTLEQRAAEDTGFEEIVRGKLRMFLRRLQGVPVKNLYEDVISRVERPLFELVLEHTNGNQLRAAEMLGVNRNTLRKKLLELGLAGKPERVRSRRR